MVFWCLVPGPVQASAETPVNTLSWLHVSNVHWCIVYTKLARILQQLTVSLQTWYCVLQHMGSSHWRECVCEACSGLINWHTCCCAALLQADCMAELVHILYQRGSTQLACIVCMVWLLLHPAVVWRYWQCFLPATKWLPTSGCAAWCAGYISASCFHLWLSCSVSYIFLV